MQEAVPLRLLTLAFILTGTVCLPQQSAAQSYARAVDKYLNAQFINGQFNGSVLVMQDGRIQYVRSHGFANAELNVAVTPETVFRIASLSKSFTAAAIVMLANRGLLSLADPVSKYLPDFPRGSEIKIEHLLAHSSGLGSVPPPADPTQEISLDSAVARLRDQRLAFAPGTQNRYSGAGFVLLAKIVEVVSHEPFDDYLRTTILRPLGMQHTGNFANSEVIADRASGYRPGPPPANLMNVARDDMSPYIGEGGMYSTVTDLARWGDAVATDRLFMMAALKYPWGWGRRKDGTRESVEQTGLHNGYASAIRVYPKERLVVVCLMNLQTGFFNACAYDVARMVFGETVAVPDKLASVQLPAATLARFVGAYEARPDLAVVLQLKDGGLQWRFANEHEWRFARPVAFNRLYLPDENATLEIVAPQSGPATELLWINPFDRLTFRKRN